MASYWLTTKEVANRCGLSPRTLVDWRKKHYGPPFFRFRGRARYKADELDRWIESQRGPT